MSDPQPSKPQNSTSASENSDTISDFTAFAEAIALLTKTFEQRMKGGSPRNQRSDKGKMEARPRERRTEGKSEVVCYRCRQKGHYASECKNKKLKDPAYYEKKLEEARKQQEVSLIAGTETWLTDDSSDDEQEEMANFCLMAKIDEEASTSEINVSHNDYEL